MLNLFALVQNPKISHNTRIEKLIRRHLNYSFNPVIIKKIFANIAFSTTRISTEKRATIIYFYYNAAIFMKHPCIVLKEQKLTIADRWEKGKLSRLVITYFFLISFPGNTVWWVCHNNIKLFPLKR